MIGSMVSQLPIVGSVYGLVKTSVRVYLYNASSPVKVVCEAVTEVVIYCSPSIVKYPLLCGYLFASGAVSVVTGGNLLLVSGTVNVVRLNN